MRILFVASSEGIHVARWINQLESQGWEIHLFPTIDGVVIHPDLKNATVYSTFYQHNTSQGIRHAGL